ncbi:isoprenyl transferase [Candidatus Hepatobacter penaei]|uniref:isoprenyl transferase n=1 Tax=Candidatus Hepatobacter penaei TaxID=1274402 RepID=UPI0004F30BB1|nr:isoprenyl transferase [Candidatus Hepatobacter penaei]TGW15123.1 isoprenyl transferase [bacterium NHP-B]
MTLPPQHIAFIIDGNGRWALNKRLSRVVGHKHGAVTVKKIIEACRKRHIPYITVYAFSSENWKRPVNEVNHLMNLFEHYLEKEQEDMLKQDIRLKVIGDRERLPPRLIQRIEHVEQASQNSQSMTVHVAFNYGGRAEIVRATQNIAAQVKRGDLALDDITEEKLTQHLYTHGAPDPDLLIRTSGEQRLSNYLLWQLAYTEFFFLDKHWPDFTEQDLDLAIFSFQKRHRRFGKAA